MKTREYQYDNLRFLLIALVVLGHLLEIARGIPHWKILYDVIYSFHMPAFLFLSGMFARLDRGKFLFGLCLPYLGLQVLYQIWDGFLLERSVEVGIAQPYWLLWYLFALIIYHLLLPIYDTPDRQKRILLLAGAFAISLLAGFDKSIGYTWSASRVLVFQPWFLLGYYFHQTKEPQRRWREMRPIWRKVFVAVCALCCWVLQWLLYRCKVASNILYGASSYTALECRWTVRLLAECCAGSMILLLLLVSEEWLRRRIPVLTTLGQNSLSIYIFHGFILRWIRYRQSGLIDGPLVLVLVWAGLLLLLGNPLIGEMAKFIFGGGWYIQLRNSQKKAERNENWLPEAVE